MGVIFYLRVVNSIHDEIGDVLVSRSRAEQDRANALKDLIRERDVQKLVTSWQDILSQWQDRNDLITEMCLRAIGSWVSWINISLVVNQTMLDLLFRQLAKAKDVDLRQGGEKVRDAAIDVFTEIVGKKMKASDKVDMIVYLNLESIVAQLTTSPPLHEHRFTYKYDTDLAETVAKLVNITVIDIVKTLDSEDSDNATKEKAEVLLQAFLPHILRYFSDEYDEICSTAIPGVNDLLSYFRKVARKNPAVIPQQSSMLLPILKAIIQKMRYDETSSWGTEDDQTDEAEFQDLRKRLNVLQLLIAATNEQLYMDAVTEVVRTTFQNLQQSGGQLDWRDLDLALHEMFLFGELAVRSGGLYTKNKPNNQASERLIEMMLMMVESDIRSFNHPATQLQFMENMRQVPVEGPDEDMSSEDHEGSADVVFNNQLYLFEAVGTICATSSIPVDKQVFYAQSIMNPIFMDMERNLGAAKSRDERALLQIHHDILALAGLAKGFSDWIPGTSHHVMPPAREVADAFGQVAEATLVALEALNFSFSIRTAARSAFSRLVSVRGAQNLPQLPRWIDGLLTQTSSKDEMALFLRLLDQVIYGFKTEIYGVLDTLLTPFLQRVFAGISEPTTGTDDEIQLAELKREYLNFLLMILNNDLGTVIISTANQPIFETVITTIEHFSKDVDDFPTAKMAFLVLSRMSNLWGGPDIIQAPNPANGAAPSQPALPGFTQYMMTRFSPLCWALPMNASFNPKDAQAKQVLGEAATLQKKIYCKTGPEYVRWLRETELPGLGMGPDLVNEYVGSLEMLDTKGFRNFFQVCAEACRFAPISESAIF
ncbi:conserved hypothetical protein [Uncinocarpus reesii 1704]|uniref:Exportin-T n=1 Tax=Uncinocarpus reesii (strain UAMH 1704) TaxID=336963 RepID=C4JJT0_UNCRE|nr:uncharacterized protein UREG_01887 [Uncinocarpus reesii 1704]EEP77038.1 conserved hypothetical protein [Uncinocarpus reesii 1704]